MKCGLCGTKYSSDVKYCAKCGLEVKDCIDVQYEFNPIYDTEANVAVKVKGHYRMEYVKDFINKVSCEYMLPPHIIESVTNYACKFYENYEKTHVPNGEKCALVLSVVSLCCKKENNRQHLNILLSDMARKFDIEYSTCIRMKREILSKFNCLYSDVTIMERAVLILAQRNVLLPVEFHRPILRLLDLYASSFNIDGKNRDFIISACSFYVWQNYTFREDVDYTHELFEQYKKIQHDRDISTHLKVKVRDFCLKFDMTYSPNVVKARLVELKNYLIILYRQFPWVRQDCSLNDSRLHLNGIMDHWHTLVYCLNNNTFKNNKNYSNPVTGESKMNHEMKIGNLMKMFSHSDELVATPKPIMYNTDKDIDREELDDDDLLGDVIEMYTYDEARILL